MGVWGGVPRSFNNSIKFIFVSFAAFNVKVNTPSMTVLLMLLNSFNERFFCLSYVRSARFSRALKFVNNV